MTNAIIAIRNFIETLSMSNEEILNTCFNNNLETAQKETDELLDQLWAMKFELGSPEWKVAFDVKHRLTDFTIFVTECKINA